MSPKEKAKELVDKFKEHAFQQDDEIDCNEAKQCALISVDEILNSSPSLPILGDGGTYGEDIELSTEWWKEVKEEIKKL